MSEELVAPPGLDEARGWVGYRLDEIGGAEVGQVHGFFVDAEDGRPTWMIARQGRLRGTLAAIPIGSCAAGDGRAWVAQERDAIRSAPVVDPTRPLLREHELTICAHYGAGENVSRASEVVGRPENSVTAQPS